MTGIGHYTANLVTGLSRLPAHHQFRILRPNGTQLGPWVRAPHMTEWFVNPQRPLWEHIELPELLTDGGVDLYHNPAFGLPLVKTCKFICTFHDCIPRLFPEYSPPWLHDFFQRWAPVWMRLADHIICDSEHTKHDITHLYGADPDKITVIYQAANEALHPVTDRERIEAVKARYGIDAPYILSVGRVELRKNVPGLLEAFRILQGRHDAPLKLVFAGPRDADAHDPHNSLPHPGRHGDVIVTGYIPTEDLAALYSGCQVFCFPSFYEGFGIPVLEAMQCGAPVVPSRVSSLPEVGGDACRYINPYDPHDISEALLAVLSDDGLRTHMREQGVARASQFTLQRFAEQTAAVYARVAAGG